MLPAIFAYAHPTFALPASTSAHRKPLCPFPRKTAPTVTLSYMKTFVIEETSPATNPPVDRWSPIPPNGKSCQFTGLKHAKLYQLLGSEGLARPHVRVVNLRTPGANRGQTLFNVGDMLRFLDRLAKEQTEAQPKEAQ